MTIYLNGEKISIEASKLTITRLLELQEVERPGMLSVQLNGNFVAQKVFGQTEIKDNDQVDFLYFMGGGICR